MDYYKYIKYKTKYLNLKYDNNQYGGGIVPCDKGYANALGTCWAVSLQVILSSGHLTSDQLNKIMESFQQGVASVIGIKENIEKFIEQQIREIKSNTELTNAFAHYKIFVDDNIVIVKDILRTFIERYYNKFMDIQFTPKPFGYINPKTNQERCEYRIAISFNKLFNTSHIGQPSNNFGNFIYSWYLFCNLLSIFFLDYKVSFTNYYDNFNTIIFKDDNDLGILIQITNNIVKHVCSLFICNDKQKFYNDNDKDQKIYDYNWKDLLQQGTTGKKLYIVNGNLQYGEYNESYMGKSIFKVEFLTVISKYNEEDTTLDEDIKTALIGNQLTTIKDRSLLTTIGKHVFNNGTQIKNKEMVSLGAQMLSLAADQYYKLGEIYQKGTLGNKDLVKAKELYFKGYHILYGDLHKHSKKAPDFSPGMNLNYNGTL
jgi:hypothetical protein